MFVLYIYMYIYIYTIPVHPRIGISQRTLEPNRVKIEGCLANTAIKSADPVASCPQA